MVANGNGSLANAWARFDDKTRLDLAVTELDRVYGRLASLAEQSSREHSQIRTETTSTAAAIKADFNERIGTLRDDLESGIEKLRAEMREGFEKQEKRSNRSIGLMYTMIGGIVVGLVMAVLSFAPH